MCHDSVSCKTWPTSEPYPVLREENEYVGQPYSEDDMPLQETESRLWPAKYTSPDCVYIHDTG